MSCLDVISVGVCMLCLCPFSLLIIHNVPCDNNIPPYGESAYLPQHVLLFLHAVGALFCILQIHPSGAVTHKRCFVPFRRHSGGKKSCICLTEDSRTYLTRRRLKESTQLGAMWFWGFLGPFLCETFLFFLPVVCRRIEDIRAC